MKTRNLYLLLIAIAILLISACKKDMKPSWEVGIATPALQTSLTMGNMLEDSMVHINPDHSITLAFSNMLYKLSLDSLVDIPDTITHAVYNIPFNLNVDPGQQILNLTEQKKFKFDEARIREMIVREGKVAFYARNTINEPVVLTYTIPSATKNGQAFTLTETVPPASAANPIFFKTFDISGFYVNMRGPNNYKFNTITTQIVAKISPDGNATTLSPADSLTIDIFFDDMTFEYARGYFGEGEYDVAPDTSRFDLFDLIQSGQIDMEEIKMKFILKNYFGIDAKAKLHYLKAINDPNGTSIALSDHLVGSNVHIGRATETGLPGTPVSPTVLEFDLSSSNMEDMMESQPDRFAYKLDFWSNPMGNNSGGNDFIYYGNGLETWLDIEIPLSLTASGLTLADTIDNNSTLEDKPDDISNLYCHLIADNNYLMSAFLSVVMLDENNNVIDTLLKLSPIAAGTEIPGSIYTNNIRTEKDIPMAGSRLDNFYSCKKFAIVARFNTHTLPYMKIYDHNKLDIKLTARFDYLIDLQ